MAKVSGFCNCGADGRRDRQHMTWCYIDVTIELTVRSRNVLAAMMYTPENFNDPIDPEIVATYREEDIIRCPNAGRRTLANIREWLACQGKTLKYGKIYVKGKEVPEIAEA